MKNILLLGATLLLSGCAHDTTAPPAPLRSLIYVSNEKSGDISVIDPLSQSVIATIPCGKRPRGLHVSRDGNTLFVALSGSPLAGPNADPKKLPPPDKNADGIGVIDLRSNKLVRKIDAGSDPEQFSLSLDENFIYVSNEDEGQLSIIDIAAGKVIAAIDVGYEPEGVTTTPDGRFVYCTCESDNLVAVLDTASKMVIAKITTNGRPRSVAFVNNGAKAYVTCENDGTIDVIDTATHKVTHQIKPQGENVRPMGITVSPDGQFAYVTTGRGKSVLKISTRNDQIIATLSDTGPRPWGIDISPDGQTLYTANGPSNDISIIDATTMQLKTKIKVNDSPWGIAVRRGR